MVDQSQRKPQSSDSTRIKFQSIFEPIDPQTRRTKIVCTIKQNSTRDELLKLLDAGMDVANVNFATGDQKSHGASVDALREALKLRPGKFCAIMLDTLGVEIRMGKCKDGKPIKLVAGQNFYIHIDKARDGDNTLISTTYKQLTETVNIGYTILLKDGACTTEVLKIEENQVEVVVKNDCVLESDDKMHLPGATLDVPSLSETDTLVIQDFGVKRGVDMVTASCCRRIEDIEAVRAALDEKKGHTIGIIAKIQSVEGVRNYEEILSAADGIMIDRQSLGMELSPDKVIIAQKYMIQKANIACKPVITYTQVFDSMAIVQDPNKEYSPDEFVKTDSEVRPTRSEASDVSVQVLDGTDCVMLLKETQDGMYPLNAVSHLGKIMTETEQCIDYRSLYEDLKGLTSRRIGQLETMASSAVATSLSLQIDLIIVYSESGIMSRMVAKYRPQVPILACSKSTIINKNLSYVRGVICHQPTEETIDMNQFIEKATDLDLIKSGCKVITIEECEDQNDYDQSNTLKIVDVE